ncbi:MAG: translocation/assembly module TamB, partial [Flavobacterium sp.]
MLLVISIALSLPAVQTKIAKYCTEEFNKKLGTNIAIDKIALTIFGTVKIKQLLIKDHHKDTLIYAKQLNTKILDHKKLFNGDLIFGDIRFNGFYLNLKNYKNEKFTNLDKFIEIFDDGKPSSGKFLMLADAIYINDGKFLLSDENRKDPKDLELKKLEARLTSFKIKGSNVDFEIEKLKFKDHRGIDLKNLESKFTYTKSNIILKNLKATTLNSEIEGSIKMSYDRKDLVDFNNKVIWDFDIINSKI